MVVSSNFAVYSKLHICFSQQSKAKKKQLQVVYKMKQDHQKDTNTNLFAYKFNILGEKIAMSNVLGHLKNIVISKKNAEKTRLHFSRSLHIGAIVHVGDDENEEAVLIVDMDPFYSTYTGIKRDGTQVYLLEGDWNESEELEKMSQELKLAHDESDVEYNKFLGKVGFKRLDTGVGCRAKVLES